jgi:hypothetical protein
MHTDESPETNRCRAAPPSGPLAGVRPKWSSACIVDCHRNRSMARLICHGYLMKLGNDQVQPVQHH